MGSSKGRIKRRVFGEYKPGPQTTPNRTYTRILITPDIPIEEARSYLQESNEFKSTMLYVQLQAVPASYQDKVVYA